MTTELTMLAFAVALLIALIVVQALSAVRAFGLAPLAGNRDDVPSPTGFAARMKRVVDNHREGLTVFAPLILIAAVAHISNRWTVLGAELFFWARLVHAALYISGAPYVRPLAYGVGVTGTLMVLGAVLGLI